MVEKYDEEEIFKISGVPQTPYGFLKRLNFIYSVFNENLVEERKYTVLDVGCGTGEYLTIPLGYLMNELNILGIDTDIKSIKYAKNKNTNPNVKFQCSTIEKLDKNSKFDFIILSEVLEHLNEPYIMLEHIRSLLNSEGICIITIPNGFGPFEIGNKIFKFLEKKNIIGYLKKLNEFRRVNKYPEESSLGKDSLCEDPHIQFFTYTKFENLCSECGLTIEYSNNRTFLAGFFSDIIINKHEKLININARIADYLPRAASSGWMFAVKKS